MIYWQTELSRQVLQKNAARGLALAIGLHVLAVSLYHLNIFHPEMLSWSEPSRTLPIELKPYAEILRLETGGGQGGGEGGGSPTAPLPKNIPAIPIPVPDAVAPTDTLATTPEVSPAIDSSNAEGTGLPGSSWGSGGTGWGTGSGSGVGLSRQIIKMPKAIMLSYPAYPPSARKAKITGIVEVNVKIDETGKVVRALLVRNTTNDAACLQEAIAAAQRYLFQPAQTAAGPDTAWMTISFSFGQ